MTLLGVLAFSSVGHAGDDCRNDCILRNASDDQNCAIEKTPLVRCQNFEEFRSRDSELNASYKFLYATLDKSDKNELKIVQRKWIRWRDETCDDAEAEANCTNGVCLGVAHDSCIVRPTERRHNELKRFQKHGEPVKARTFDFSRSSVW